MTGRASPRLWKLYVAMWGMLGVGHFEKKKKRNNRRQDLSYYVFLFVILSIDINEPSFLISITKKRFFKFNNNHYDFIMKEKII